METMRLAKFFKNEIKTRSLCLALSFGACVAASAMSDLVTVSVAPQWPAVSQPGTVLRYQVTVTRSGEGELEVSLSALGLPHGATVTFSPSVLRFTGRAPVSMSATMTVTCPEVMTIDDNSFSVIGSTRRESVTSTKGGSALASVQTGTPVLFFDLANGQDITLRGMGVSGVTYQIETASDLRNPSWTKVGPSTADGNGRFIFNDTVKKNLPAQFYRAVQYGS
jgi:hypothetical protein